MKQSILHFMIAFSTFAIAIQGQAQVTIDQSNFLRGTAYIDTVIRAAPSFLAGPSEGPDQVWDYSSLEAELLVETEHFAASNHPGFPAATSFYRSDLSFQGFPIEGYTYETVDAAGWTTFGVEVTGVSYSITTITGGPTDSLRFIGGSLPGSAPNDLIKFPATYQDQWTSVVTGNTPFELTVAAFGLDQVPGNRKRTVTANRSIVGYGELTIPTLDGSPSAPIQALLMKTTNTAVDSVFLGGAPAPDPLLAAFGLVQGGMLSSEFYFFYMPGFGSSPLFYSPSSGAFTYRPQAAQISTSIFERAEIAILNSYPNPVVAGEILNVQMESQVSDGQLVLFDITGRLVHLSVVESEANNRFTMKIPEGVRNGLYLYQVLDQKGMLTGVGKIQIE